MPKDRETNSIWPNLEPSLIVLNHSYKSIYVTNGEGGGGRGSQIENKVAHRNKKEK